MGPAPRSPRDVSNVYAYLLSRDAALFSSEKPATNDPGSYYQSEAEYFAFHNQVLALEARIFTALSFDTHVSLPHPLAITYLQTLDFLNQPSRTAISARTLQYLNTALLSPQLLYLTHQPHALATAAIYAAARDVGAKMPRCEWWDVFDVDREDLGFLVVGMRSLEGWVRKRREEVTGFGEGMLTRGMVGEEMRKRGMDPGDGEAGVDEERAVMEAMDRR